MKHAKLTDPLREQAALYALGALAPAEARTYEAHLEDGCRVCGAEVEVHGAVTGNLALAATPAAPRPDVRTRLLAAARESAPAAPRSPFRFVLNGEGDWTEVEPGVFQKPLAGGPGTDSTSYLIRMQPGVRVNTHQHTAVEHCYVIDGDLRIAGRHLHAGDFHLADRGSTHEGIASEQGCVLLIVESHA